MLNTILGTKSNMSQTFVGDTRVPVTRLRVGPYVVTQLKTEEKDGYWAVQIGFGSKKIKNTTKPLQGHLNKAQNPSSKDSKEAPKTQNLPRFLKEVRFNKMPTLNLGDQLKPSDVLKPGDLVQVTGVSKGKGFAGVVKRWKFAGGPKTHGQSNRHRSPGSIGQGTTPGRVWKGKKMAGRMGSETAVIKNLTVISIDNEKNEILVSGSVPGPKDGLIVIKKTAEGKVENLIKKVAQIKAKGKTGESGESE